MRYIRIGDEGDVINKTGSFASKIGYNFLITEIRRFLDHQLSGKKKGIGYIHDKQPDSLVVIDQLEAVL